LRRRANPEYLAHVSRKLARRLAWLVLLVVLLGVLRARGRGALSGPLAALQAAAGDVHYTKLTPLGDTLEGGIYDPSLAYTPDGATGWLAYSSVTGAHRPIGEYVHTHLARSADGGATWRFVREVNRSEDGTLRLPDGTSLAGVWRYEVPTLVDDVADPDAGRRWKLFAHCYFWSPKSDRMVVYGWIALRCAADPGGEWSASEPLFGAGPNPAAPYHQTRVDINGLDASLRDVVAYSEPGALARDGKLYLSMTALRPRFGPTGMTIDHTVILLASDDHGRAWRFVNKLLTAQDADGLGCDCFDGTALAVDRGRVFLLAAPMTHSGTEVCHGTVAFEFESLADGRLRRDERQQPVVAAYFAPQPGLFSGSGAGQATYDAGNVHGGLLMPEFNLKAYPEVFQVFSTGRGLVAEKAP
jgi:hypothetical protein